MFSDETEKTISQSLLLFKEFFINFPNTSMSLTKSFLSYTVSAPTDAALSKINGSTLFCDVKKTKTKK